MRRNRKQKIAIDKEIKYRYLVFVFISILQMLILLMDNISWLFFYTIPLTHLLFCS